MPIMEDDPGEGRERRVGMSRLLRIEGETRDSLQTALLMIGELNVKVAVLTDKVKLLSTIVFGACAAVLITVLAAGIALVMRR